MSTWWPTLTHELINLDHYDSIDVEPYERNGPDDVIYRIIAARMIPPTTGYAAHTWHTEVLAIPNIDNGAADEDAAYAELDNILGRLRGIGR